MDITIIKNLIRRHILPFALAAVFLAALTVCDGTITSPNNHQEENENGDEDENEEGDEEGDENEDEDEGEEEPFSGTGIFAYTVNFPGGVSAATLTKAQMGITNNEGETASGWPRSILAAPDGSMELAAGSWKIEFDLDLRWGSSILRSNALRSETIMIEKDKTLNKTWTFDYRDFELLLAANAGSGSAYPVIQSRGFDYESPDQPNGSVAGHNFGPHILQQYDSTLQKNVFAFITHRDTDRNATGDWTRQRLEIKIDHRNGNYGRDYCGLASPDEGRSFIHRWKFKLPADFAVSTEFTHIHQIKNEGGDASQPVIALTARAVGSNQRMQLTYYAPESSTAVHLVTNSGNTLSDYLGQWVQCEESITYSSNAAQAAYSLKITRIADNKVLINYNSANDIITWRTGNTHGRPKFGLYRRIYTGDNPGNNQEPPEANIINGLKDETLLYADFEVVRLK